MWRAKFFSIFAPSHNRDVDGVEGESIAGLLQRAGYVPDVWPQLRVTLGGVTVPQEWWDKVRPKANLNVVLVPAGDGGTGLVDKGTLRTAASLLGLLGSQILGAAVSFSGVWGVVFQVGMNLLASLIPLALIAPPKEIEAAELYSLRQSRNTARPFEPLRKVYGKLRVFPDLVGTVSELEGDDQYVKILLAVGYKPLKLSDFKLGDTPIAEYGDAIVIQQSTGVEDIGDPLDLFSENRDVREEYLERQLEQAPVWYEGDGGLNENVVSFRTAENTSQISLDLIFPRGLYRKDSSGNIAGERVDIAIRYRPSGASGDTWQYLPQPTDSVLNDEVARLLDEDVFNYIEDAIDWIDDLIDNLDAIAEEGRVLSDSLRNILRNQLLLMQETVNSRLAGTTLTGPQETTFNALGTRINTLLDIIDDATEVVDDAADTLSDFNSYLTVLVKILYAIDTWIRFQDYIASGGTTQTVEDLVDWKKYPFLYLALRAIIHRRNLDRLFGPAEDGAFVLSNVDKKAGMFRRSFRWDVPAGKWEVQIRRTSEDSNDENIISECIVGSVRSVSPSAAVSDAIRETQALVAIRARATNQLTNALDRFNCIAESPLPWHNGTAWQPAAIEDDDGNNVSCNPAWQYADALRGAATKSAATNAQIDVTRIRQFAAYCTAGGYQFSGMFDRPMVAERAWQAILAAGFGSSFMRAGKYSIVYDHEQTESVAAITMANSKGFSGFKSFATRPHALRMRYVNADAGDATDEMLVYADGYGDPEVTNEWTGLFDGAGAALTLPFEVDSVTGIIDRTTGKPLRRNDYTVTVTDGQTVITRWGIDTWESGSLRWQVTAKYTPMTPTIFEEMDTFGLRDSPDPASPNHTGNVWAHGRRILATVDESFEVTMDYEHIAFERGDRVDLQYDTALWGLYSGRIAGGVTSTSFNLEAPVTLEAGVTYDCLIRSQDNELYTGRLAAASGNVTSVTFTTAPTITFAAGDLYSIGVAGSATVPCLVKEIAHRSDLSAVVTLIQYNAGKYYAEAYGVPTLDPRITIPPDPELVRPAAPVIVSVRTDEGVLDVDQYGRLRARIAVQLASPDDVSHIELQYRRTGGTLWENTPLVQYGTGLVYVTDVQQGAVYDIRARFLTAGGLSSDWTLYPDITVVGQSSPPPDVTELDLHAGIELRWAYPLRPADLAGFEVRGVLGVGGTWESAAPLHEGLITDTRFAIPTQNDGPRVYFVKARDLSGNYSTRAARLVLALGDILVSNVVVETNYQDEHWPGTLTEMDKSAPSPPAVLEAVAGNKAGFYRGGGAPFYHGNFYQTEYPEVAYEFQYVIDGSTTDASAIKLDITATGPEWFIEWKNEAGGLLWPADMESTLWPAESESMLWPAELHWQPYTGALRVVPGVVNTYTFRVRALPSDDQLVISGCKVIEDVADIVDRVEDFTVASTGTVRLPLRRTFTEIRNVQLAVQYDAGHPNAHTAIVLDKSTSGPSVQVLDATGARTSGVVDAIVQGF